MIKVKSLEPKGKTTFTLTIDDKEKSQFILHQETVIMYQLLSKKTLDEKTYKAMLKQDQFHHAYARALSKLTHKNYTQKRLKETLKKDGIPIGIANQVIDRLVEDKYLNDDKTLAMIVEDFLAFELKGRHHLKKKLENQGFDEDKIAESLEKLTPDIETTKCRALLEKTVKAQKPMPKEKLKVKLQSKCYQQGFSQSTSHALIEAIVRETDTAIDESRLLDEAYEKAKKQYNVLEHRERQKLIQKLLRQGFRYEMIQKKLNS